MLRHKIGRFLTFVPSSGQRYWKFVKKQCLYNHYYYLVKSNFAYVWIGCECQKLGCRTKTSAILGLTGYYGNFDDFCAAINDCIENADKKYEQELKSPMTLVSYPSTKLGCAACPTLEKPY